MKISIYTDSDKSEFDQFKISVWQKADQEHYGTKQPDFSKHSFTLVAKKDTEIIGYVSVEIDAGVARIEPLMVSYEAHGKGVGSALLTQAEIKARDLGAHKIWLETGLHWIAKKFYENHGYNIRAELPNHTGNQTFVLMDKMLK